MKSILMSLLLVGCFNSPKKEVDKVEVTFGLDEVVGAIVALQGIIDYPQETQALQKNLQITSDQSLKLMMPLHAYYDQKIDEEASIVARWSDQDVISMESTCAQKCQCEFYLDVLERHADLLAGGSLKLKEFGQKKYLSTKVDKFKCLEQLPPIQNLINQLKLELKDYQADSVI